jgi:hypothetical protein
MTEWRKIFHEAEEIWEEVEYDRASNSNSDGSERASGFIQ